jgi:hypothetical protein
MTGQIIGAVDLYDIIQHKDELLDQHGAEWFTGPIGWCLRNAKQFSKGFPALGRLGLWNSPPELVLKIEPQL